MTVAEAYEKYKEDGYFYVRLFGLRVSVDFEEREGGCYPYPNRGIVVSIDRDHTFILMDIVDEFPIISAIKELIETSVKESV